MAVCYNCGVPLQPGEQVCPVCSHLPGRPATLPPSRAPPSAPPPRSPSGTRPRTRPKGPNPWFVALLILALMLGGVGLALLLDLTSPDENQPPSVKLTKLRLESGNYELTVVQVSRKAPLVNLTYHLKDHFSLTWQRGAVGLHNLSGLWQGVDVTWDDEGDRDLLPGNGLADRAPGAGGPYSDPYQAQQRILAVKQGGQTSQPYQQSEGALSVSFYDKDRDGRLSPSDLFLVRGNSAYHPANDGSIFQLRFGSQDRLAGQVKLGAGPPTTPLLALESSPGSKEGFDVEVLNTTEAQPLRVFRYFLKDRDGTSRQHGEIALQNLSGQWAGVEVTWDDGGSADTSPGNGLADRADSAGGPYSDPYQAQVRIEDVIAGSQTNTEFQRSEGTLSVTFHDRDRDGNLSVGDTFHIRTDGENHPANDDFILEIRHVLSGESAGGVRLG